MYNPPMERIIKTIFASDTLSRIPRKIKMSYNAYQLLKSMCDTRWIASIEDERWDGIPIEIDRDLFGYTYEFVYEDEPILKTNTTNLYIKGENTK